MGKYLCVLILPMVLISCSSGDQNGAPEAKVFFDLRDYMDAEVKRLMDRRQRVEKTITLNGETETREIEDLNFANDLRVFREADINKPAWVEKYVAEVEKLSGSHQIATYTARDSSLQTRKLVVEQDQGVVTRISIDRKTGTVLSDGHHQLEYSPATGYSMTTKQDNRFGKDVRAEIRVRW